MRRRERTPDRSGGVETQRWWEKETGLYERVKSTTSQKFGVTFRGGGRPSEGWVEGLDSLVLRSGDVAGEP